MMAVELRKQNELDANPRTTQQINFTANLDRSGTQESFLVLKKQKKLD